MSSKFFVPFLLAVGFAATAHAEPLTSPIQATASVVPSCSITKTQDAARLSYNPVGANATQKVMSTGPQTARFVVKCNRQAGITASIGQGLHPSAGSTCEAPLRNMETSTGARLAYRLNHSLTDNGNFVLGCGINNMRALDFSSSNTANFAAIVVLDPGQAAAVGDYSDTVLATVIF